MPPETNLENFLHAQSNYFPCVPLLCRQTIFVLIRKLLFCALLFCCIKNIMTINLHLQDQNFFFQKFISFLFVGQIRNLFSITVHHTYWILPIYQILNATNILKAVGIYIIPYELT